MPAFTLHLVCRQRLETNNGEASHATVVDLVDVPTFILRAKRIDPRFRMQTVLDEQLPCCDWSELHAPTLCNLVDHLRPQPPVQCGVGRTWNGYQVHLESREEVCITGHGCANDDCWHGLVPTFHFEVVTAEDGTGSPFMCSWSQFLRVSRKLHALTNLFRSSEIL